MILRNLNYLLILVGGALALYEQSLEEPKQYLLILGLFLLMVGIYRTSKNIPSKSENSSESDQNEEE